MVERSEFIEKLNAAHEFPCSYTFKLIGPAEAQIEKDALAIVEAEMPGTPPIVSTRHSANGNHLSVTLVLPMPDAETVANMYERFNAIEGLHMML